MIVLLYVVAALITWLVVSVASAFLLGRVIQLRERRGPLVQLSTSKERLGQHG